MSLSEDVKLWSEAVSFLDHGSPDLALEKLISMEEQSCRIRINIGLCYQKMDLTRQAIEVYTDASVQDPHCALVFFLRACANFKQNSFAEALSDFRECHTRLRGKKFIDYGQLGMRYKLYTCEILHNQGVCHLYLGDYTTGMELLLESRKVKVEARHKAVDRTLDTLNIDRQSCRNVGLILLSSNLIFRPPKSKVQNLEKVNFLGTAKVVCAETEDDKFSGFSGTQLLDITRQSPTFHSAPDSPVLRRAQGAPSRPQQELVDHVTHALSPDREHAPSVLRPEDAHRPPARTPPARWSPNTVNKANIPPPPLRDVPQLKRRTPKGITDTPKPPPPSKNTPKPPPPTKNTPKPPVPKVVLQGSAQTSQHPIGALLAGNHGNSEEGQHRTGFRKNPVALPPRSGSSSQGQNLNPPELPPRIASREPAASHHPGYEDVAEPVSMVTVTLICVGEQVVMLPRETTLESVMEKAQTAFHLTIGTFDIWRKNSEGTFLKIENDAEFQVMWSRLETDNAMLWVFGKR